MSIQRSLVLGSFIVALTGCGGHLIPGAANSLSAVHAGTLSKSPTQVISMTGVPVDTTAYVDAVSAGDAKRMLSYDFDALTAHAHQRFTLTGGFIAVLKQNEMGVAWESIGLKLDGQDYQVEIINRTPQESTPLLDALEAVNGKPATLYLSVVPNNIYFRLQLDAVARAALSPT